MVHLIFPFIYDMWQWAQLSGGTCGVGTRYIAIDSTVTKGDLPQTSLDTNIQNLPVKYSLV